MNTVKQINNNNSLDYSIIKTWFSLIIVLFKLSTQFFYHTWKPLKTIYGCILLGQDRL